MWIQIMFVPSDHVLFPRQREPTCFEVVPPNTSWLTYAGRLAVVAVVEHRGFGVDGVAGHHTVVLLQLELHRRRAATVARSLPRSIRAGVLPSVLAPPSPGIGGGIRIRDGAQLVISASQRSRRQRRRAKVAGIVAELPPPPLVVLPIVAEQAATAQNELLLGLQYLVLLDEGALLGVLQDAALLGELALLHGTSRLQWQYAMNGLLGPMQQLLILPILVRNVFTLHLDVVVPIGIACVQAVHILQHIGAHNGLIIDAGAAHIGVHRSAMAVTMSVTGRRAHGRRGGFAVRWLLALHIRLVQQGKLAAAVALQLPSRILEAAVEDTTALASRQALFFFAEGRANQYPNIGSGNSKSGKSGIRSRSKISRRERSESRKCFVSEILGKRPPEQQSSKPKPLNAFRIQTNFLLQLNKGLRFTLYGRRFNHKSYCVSPLNLT